MTSKQRAYLMSLASNEQAILHIGKDGLTPEVINAAREAIEKRELIKVSVLKNCSEKPGALAQTLAQRLGATPITVIGKKIVLYRPALKPVIELPK